MAEHIDGGFVTVRDDPDWGKDVEYPQYINKGERIESYVIRRKNRSEAKRDDGVYYVFHDGLELIGSAGDNIIDLVGYMAPVDTRYCAINIKFVRDPPHLNATYRYLAFASTAPYFFVAKYLEDHDLPPYNPPLYRYPLYNWGPFCSDNYAYGGKRYSLLVFENEWITRNIIYNPTAYVYYIIDYTYSEISDPLGTVNEMETAKKMAMDIMFGGYGHCNGSSHDIKVGWNRPSDHTELSTAFNIAT